ncbi:MAG TPA: BON domain-containing protein [Acidobacteriaceae bacterium]|jgi:osmotically-inducible protein OsmY|nr:BON domain-containing protein [Acidobacteriaceae bacterium]
MKKIIVSILAAVLAVSAAFAQNDVQAAVQKALSGSHFKDVRATVENGVATLTGTVDLYADKVRADQKVRHVKGVQAIRDEIQVAGPEISDQQLQAKLINTVAYSLVGYVPVAFQAISVQVHNGVVELAGHAAGPIAASDAVAAVENTKGVKDVIDNIQVDPLSPMDNQIRMEAYRKIYGFPSLNKYAMDPAKPIRIQVANGHITLYGTVDNQGDKNAAGIQANSVPGAFSVTNNLQVANGGNEKPGK